MEENGMMCLAHGTIALRKLHSLSSSWEPATACAGPPRLLCSGAFLSHVQVPLVEKLQCQHLCSFEEKVALHWPPDAYSCKIAELEVICLITCLFFSYPLHFNERLPLLTLKKKRGVEDHDCLDRGMSVTQVNVNEVMRPFPLFLSAFSCN